MCTCVPELQYVVNPKTCECAYNISHAYDFDVSVSVYVVVVMLCIVCKNITSKFPL